jgi:glycosyltransferase involved in cell wall biosynthesis
MRISVIVATYNEPEWLEKVLWGYSVQTNGDFELIIADDGSGKETGLVIAKMQAATGMAIKHIWHEDKGFRKCEILNKAILQAENDYLIFSDGDCIPRADFVAEHVSNVRRGYFLTGSCIRLPLATSEAISKDDIVTNRCFDWQWLVARGLPVTRKNIKLKATKKWAGLLNSWIITLAPFCK